MQRTDPFKLWVHVKSFKQPFTDNAKALVVPYKMKKIIEPNGDAKIAADRDFLTMYFFTCQFDILSRFIGLKKKGLTDISLTAAPQ